MFVCVCVRAILADTQTHERVLIYTKNYNP